MFSAYDLADIVEHRLDHQDLRIKLIRTYSDSLTSTLFKTVESSACKKVEDFSWDATSIGLASILEDLSNKMTVISEKSKEIADALAEFEDKRTFLYREQDRLKLEQIELQKTLVDVHSKMDFKGTYRFLDQIEYERLDDILSLDPITSMPSKGRINFGTWVPPSDFP